MAGVRITQLLPMAVPGGRYGDFSGRQPAATVELISLVDVGMDTPELTDVAAGVPTLTSAALTAPTLTDAALEV